MATAITDSSITGIVSGAYGDLVKLDDGRVVNLATFLKETDDGGTDTIVGIIKGAYESQVLLSDGSIKTLSEHVRSPGALTIAGIISGAYANQAKVADGMIVNLAEKVKADEGGGSALQAKVADGMIVNLAEKVKADKGGDSALSSEEDFKIGLSSEIAAIALDAKIVNYKGNDYLLEKFSDEVFRVSKQVEGDYVLISDISPLARGVVKQYKEGYVALGQHPILEEE